MRVLVTHEVDFAMAGGLAGVMQGAPIHTQDLDILYSLKPPNTEPLLRAAEELESTSWGDACKLRPCLSHMESRGHKLLATRSGRMDCLATIEESTPLKDVENDIDWMELDGIPVRVLSLTRLIEVKRKLSRPKINWLCCNSKPRWQNARPSSSFTRDVDVAAPADEHELCQCNRPTEPQGNLRHH